MITPGCAGCDAARLKLPPVAHSEACRARIAGEMEKTEAGRRRLGETQGREQIAFERALEEEERRFLGVWRRSQVDDRVHLPNRHRWKERSFGQL